MSSRYRVVWGAFAAVLLAACEGNASRDAGSIASVTASPVPAPAVAVATGRTLYEHTDERGLPVGTKIFGTGSATIFVFPGEKAPARLAHRRPDIIVIE